jgi:hypothetical protein
MKWQVGNWQVGKWQVGKWQVGKWQVGKWQVDEMYKKRVVVQNKSNLLLKFVLYNT